MKPFGLILMGGLSTRMGTDKSSIERDGTTWAARAMTIVSPYTQETFLSVRKGSHHAFALHDDFENIGPAAGLLRAHREHPTRSWLIFAVDFPLATSESVGYLLEQAERDRADVVCYQHEDGTPEPLFAVWSPRALKELTQNVAKGLTGPMATLKQIGFSMVLPKDAAWVRNVNTQEELNRLIQPITL